MSHFIEGLDRQQAMLIPEHLDDYVSEHSPVRAIDAFADMLDLVVRGFDAPVVTARQGSARHCPEARMERALKKLDHLQKEAVRFQSIDRTQRMDKTGETQVSFSDLDARSMATTARMPRIVGYNVQAAFEADSHLPWRRCDASSAGQWWQRVMP